MFGHQTQFKIHINLALLRRPYTVRSTVSIDQAVISDVSMQCFSVVWAVFSTALTVVIFYICDAESKDV